MKDSISEAFSSSIKEVLISLCNCDVSIDTPQEIEFSKTLGDISIILEINGQLRGQVIYTMSETFSLEIASQMMEMPITEIDDLTLSALSEIGNIVTGNATTKLSGLGFYCETTIPKVVKGKDKPLKLYSDHATLITAFTSLGSMTLCIVTKS